MKRKRNRHPKRYALTNPSELFLALGNGTLSEPTARVAAAMLIDALPDMPGGPHTVDSLIELSRHMHEHPELESEARAVADELRRRRN